MTIIHDSQIDDMLHALGQSQTHDRADTGWRNYYDAGVTNESWEDLVQKGLAWKSDGRPIYHVTALGMKLLGVTIK